MYQEADELYLRAIGIQEKVLGPDHPDLGTLLNNRASGLGAQVIVIFLPGDVSR